MDLTNFFLPGLPSLWSMPTNQATIDELRTNTEREIAAVSPDICLKIVKNWVKGLEFCKRAGGGQPKEIEFHS